MTIPTVDLANQANRDFVHPGSLWLASSAEPAARGDLRGSGPVRFKTVSGLELEATVPAVKLALYELGRVWPHALRLDDLAERIAGHLGEGSKPAGLFRLLFDSPAKSAIRAFPRSPRSVRAPSQKPLATPLARLQAVRGVEVTNLHREPVRLEVAFHRRLLSLLDGTRDRDAVARALSDEGREVDAGLERLARYALLMA